MCLQTITFNQIVLDGFYLHFKEIFVIFNSQFIELQELSYISFTQMTNTFVY